MELVQFRSHVYMGVFKPWNVMLLTLILSSVVELVVSYLPGQFALDLNVDDTCDVVAQRPFKNDSSAGKLFELPVLEPSSEQLNSNSQLLFPDFGIFSKTCCKQMLCATPRGQQSRDLKLQISEHLCSELGNADWMLFIIILVWLIVT